MTATYRRVLRYEPDGAFNYGTNGRQSRSTDKPLARRIKRREHFNITREAVQSWYTNAADDLAEYHAMLNDEEWGDYLEYLAEDDYRDDYIEEDYIEDDYDYGSYDFYDHDPYDDLHDYWGTSPISPEDTRRIEREDIGKSLGDILEEIRQRQGL